MSCSIRICHDVNGCPNRGQSDKNVLPVYAARLLKDCELAGMGLQSQGAVLKVIAAKVSSGDGAASTVLSLAVGTYCGAVKSARRQQIGREFGELHEVLGRDAFDGASDHGKYLLVGMLRSPCRGCAATA